LSPCAFVHFAVDTIHGKSLIEILHNPIFKAYQERQPFSDNMLRPCALIDVPEALREIVNESGASPTHEGDDSVLYGDYAAAMDQIAATWRAKANQKEVNVK